MNERHFWLQLHYVKILVAITPALTIRKRVSKQN